MDPPCSARDCGAAFRISGTEEGDLTSTETGNNSFHTLRLVSLLCLIFHSHSGISYFLKTHSVLWCCFWHYITVRACVCCKNRALQEASHQSKATVWASFTPIHPEDPRLAWQNQLPDIVLLTITGYSCCLIHQLLICSILCWDSGRHNFALLFLTGSDFYPDIPSLSLLRHCSHWPFKLATQALPIILPW